MFKSKEGKVNVFITNNFALPATQNSDYLYEPLDDRATV